MRCEDEYENTIREAGNQATNSNGDGRTNTLPDSQVAHTKCAQNEIPQIIDRIISIAREIGWLTERKVPVESDSGDSTSQLLSR